MWWGVEESLMAIFDRLEDREKKDPWSLRQLCRRGRRMMKQKSHHMTTVQNQEKKSFFLHFSSCFVKVPLINFYSNFSLKIASLWMAHREINFFPNLVSFQGPVSRRAQIWEDLSSFPSFNPILCLLERTLLRDEFFIQAIVEKAEQVRRKMFILYSIKRTIVSRREKKMDMKQKKENFFKVRIYPKKDSVKGERILS